MESLKALLQQSGLKTAPSQIWKSVRLVPVIAESIVDDLHLAPHKALAWTWAGYDKNKSYSAFVPYGLVLSEGKAAAQTQLGAAGQQWQGVGLRYLDRMVQRKSQQLHFLPQHLGVAAFLANNFKAPEIYWRDFYSRKALREGLSPRYLQGLSGEALVGLDEALRVFEIHARQVGMLLFFGDVLAAAVIYPHPSDYRLLHSFLLQEVYAQDLWWASYYYRELPALEPPELAQPPQQLADLSRFLDQQIGFLTDFEAWMASPVLDVPLARKVHYQWQQYQLQSWIGPLHYGQPGFAGEMIVSEQRLAYLHSFRLEPKQVNEAWVLQQLAQHQWNPEATAKALGFSFNQWVRRMDKVGLGRIVQRPWLDQAYAELRKKK